MLHRAAILLAIAAAIILVSCATDHKRDAHSASSATVAHESEIMDDQYETSPPRETVSDVMQAKLAHTQAVLEGLALADYEQVETNARALKRISQGGDWLAQESETYFEFSAEFRKTCDDLINHSRAQSMQAIVADYTNLTHSCVACHDYLRMERQTKDLPGRVSMWSQP